MIKEKGSELIYLHLRANTHFERKEDIKTIDFNLNDIDYSTGSLPDVFFLDLQHFYRFVLE